MASEIFWNSKPYQTDWPTACPFEKVNGVLGGIPNRDFVFLIGKIQCAIVQRDEKVRATESEVRARLGEATLAGWE